LGELTALPQSSHPLAGYSGPTSKGRGGHGKERSGRKRREGREESGMKKEKEESRSNFDSMAPPMNAEYCSYVA